MFEWLLCRPQVLECFTSWPGYSLGRVDSKFGYSTYRKLPMKKVLGGRHGEKVWFVYFSCHGNGRSGSHLSLLCTGIEDVTRIHNLGTRHMKFFLIKKLWVVDTFWALDMFWLLDTFRVNHVDRQSAHFN